MRPSPTLSRYFSLSLLFPLCLTACGEDEPVELNPAPVDGTDDTDGTTDGAETDVPMRPSGAGGGPSVPPVTTTPVPAGPSPFGRVCELDGDCADGLRCMQVDSGEWLGGGPGHGYCTADCSADTGVCLDLDPTSLCVQFEGPEPLALCMQGCPVGPFEKCQNRADVACDAVSLNGYGFCRPMCRSDADCDGLACDVGSGACVEELPEGDPIGSECDPDAEMNSCQTGLCLPFAPDYAFCSGFCNVSETGCGLDNDIPEEPGEPICAWPVLTDSGPGDLGFCNQRCNCDDDCLHPDFQCLILPEDVAEFFGSDGLCVDPDFPTEDDPTLTLGRECPAGGGADAGSVDAAPMSSAPDASSEPPPMDDASAPQAPSDAAPPEAPVDASGDR